MPSVAADERTNHAAQGECKLQPRLLCNIDGCAASRVGGTSTVLAFTAAAPPPRRAAAPAARRVRFKYERSRRCYRYLGAVCLLSCRKLRAPRLVPDAPELVHSRAPNGAIRRASRHQIYATINRVRSADNDLPHCGKFSPPSIFRRKTPPVCGPPPPSAGSPGTLVQLDASRGSNPYVRPGEIAFDMLVQYTLQWEGRAVGALLLPVEPAIHRGSRVGRTRACFWRGWADYAQRANFAIRQRGDREEQSSSFVAMNDLQY